MEIVSVFLGLFLAVVYNLVPLAVVVQMKKAGIVNNEGFYGNDDVMSAWLAYLVFNLVIESIIATTLCIVTIRTILTIKQFFREQYFKQTASLILVTIATLATFVLCLLNDAGLTILQLQQSEAQRNESTDGLAIGGLILWIPSFTINFLHLRNIRMQKKCLTDVPNLPMPLSGSLINEIDG